MTGTQGHSATITELIDAGAKVNTTGSRGKTPLFAAVTEGHAVAVAALLEVEANVNIEFRGRIETITPF